MKIERFKAQIDNLQRNNRYNVAMFGTGHKNNGLAIRGIKCDSATLPGRGFFMNEDSEYGPKRAIPHKPQNPKTPKPLKSEKAIILGITDK